MLVQNIVQEEKNAKIFSDVPQQVALPYGESVCSSSSDNPKPLINQYHHPSGEYSTTIIIFL